VQLIAGAVANMRAPWREISGLRLPLIVNADFAVGKNDLTRCDQVK